MILPSEKEARYTLYRELVESCMASRDDRKSRYDILRKWYLFGNDSTERPVEYNKLFPHVDLLASYLFSGETTAFNIVIPDNKEVGFYDNEVAKAFVLTKPLNDQWHDSNTDLVFNDALIWGLVYDTTFVKMVPLGKRQVMSYVLSPDTVGVLNENVSFLDGQEAICHEFFMSEHYLNRLIKDWPSKIKKEILGKISLEKSEKQEKSAPSGVQTLIINSTTPNIVGEVSNAALNINYSFAPKIMERGVLCHELWVFDDTISDYRKVVLVEGEQILTESEGNPFVKGEHCFIKVTPNPLPNYFWGRSELMYLTPIQEWINTRIPQLKELMAKQANPPSSMTGFSGITGEKYAAFMKAGGFFTDSSPANMSKIEQFKPDMGNDIFRELATIEEMFGEISGIKEIMKGGGEKGVRAEGHANLLARLGSSRAKKKAFILEDAAEKCATLLLKVISKFDDTHYQTKDGKTTFIAKQLTPLATVKVDAHSSSPLFMESQKEDAAQLFQAGVYDGEDLLDALRVPNAEAIKIKYKKRQHAMALAKEKEERENAQGGKQS